MTAVGFEPTRIAPPELESGALDRSAKLTGARTWDNRILNEFPDFYSRHEKLITL